MPTKGSQKTTGPLLTRLLLKQGLRYEDNQIERLSAFIVNVLVDQKIAKEDRTDYLQDNLLDLVRAWKQATGPVSIQILYAVDDNLPYDERLRLIRNLLQHDSVARHHSLSDSPPIHVDRARNQHLVSLTIRFDSEPTIDVVNSEALDAIMQLAETDK